MLGEDAFGTVYKGLWNQAQVAVKEMSITFQEFEIIQPEINFMAKNKHPRLVGYSFYIFIIY